MKSSLSSLSTAVRLTEQRAAATAVMFEVLSGDNWKKPSKSPEAQALAMGFSAAQKSFH